MTRTALIIGGLGQDGRYLANYLAANNYRVICTSRRPDVIKLKQIYFEHNDKVEVNCLNPLDKQNLQLILNTLQPAEIYMLSAQSSVGYSFVAPKETLDSIVLATYLLMDCLRKCTFDFKLYYAGSSECFGDQGHLPITANSPFKPTSPYAIAKCSAHFLIEDLRKLGYYACTGFLFNHDSILRPENFVLKKVAKSVVQIKMGNSNELRLGNVEIVRDWGLASEYVEAMHLMLQLNDPKDFVIGTGTSVSLKKLVKYSFEYVGLDYLNYLKIDPQFKRNVDIKENYCSTVESRTILGWKAKTDYRGVMRRLIDNEFY